MISVRKAEERGHGSHGWLDTYHTFSFANYFDPRYRGFRDLLVINEDRVGPGSGFGKHGHENMEIVTYVLSGALTHQDSMGSRSTLRYGDVQRMSAGTGVLHSERNEETAEPVHLLQIWIATGEPDIRPEYEEKHFSTDEKTNRLKLIVSPKGGGGSLRIHQDASIYAALLDEGKQLTHQLPAGRYAWLQVARGSLDLNGVRLNAGDGAAISDERELMFAARTAAEVLVFDLA